MRNKIVSGFSIASFLLFAVAVVNAQTIQGAKPEEGAKQAEKATEVLGDIMKTPDKGIPQDLLDKAECVMVFRKW